MRKSKFIPRMVHVLTVLGTIVTIGLGTAWLVEAQELEGTLSTPLLNKAPASIAPKITVTPSRAQQPKSGYRLITGWKVDIAFFSPWYEPHYAAYFWSSYCGPPQHYLGPGGDGATCGSSHGCISTWDWHWNNNGSGRNQLLLPKGGWLWDENPNGPRWQGYNYQGYCWLD